MSESIQSWVLPAVGSMVVGLIFVSSQVSQEQAATNVANLPALEARLTRLEEELAFERAQVAELRESIANTLDRSSLDANFDAIDAKIEALDAQLARRLQLEIKGQQELIKEATRRELDQLQEFHKEDVMRLQQMDEKIQALYGKIN